MVDEIVISPITEEMLKAFESGELRYYWETKEVALKRLKKDCKNATS